MDGLRISPLWGLLALWISSGCNLFIPSGLKKMTLKVHQENMQVTSYFDFNNLFDRYTKKWCNLLVSSGLKNTTIIINSHQSRRDDNL